MFWSVLGKKGKHERLGRVAASLMMLMGFPTIWRHGSTCWPTRSSAQRIGSTSGR